MTARRPAACLLALALLAACGGGGGDDDESATTTAGATETTAPADDTATTGFSTPAAEFEDADARVRFVNAFSDAGADSDLNLDFTFSWGGYSGGEEAASLGYGEMSELLGARVLANSFSEVEPGTVDLGVVAQRADAADDDQPLMSDDETVAEGQELVWIVGTDEDMAGEGATTVQSRWIFVDGGEDDVPEPTDGKANLFLIDNGVGHLENDFVTMGAPGACLTFQNDSGGGNAGPVYEVDPGSMQLGIYDANGGCAEPTGELVTLDAEAGHRYLVVALGHTQQTRTAVIIDLDE